MKQKKRKKCERTEKEQEVHQEAKGGKRGNVVIKRKREYI